MKTQAERINGFQRFYMPYMTLNTLDQLKETGNVTDTEHYSMFDYEGPLQLEIFDRHYSVA